MLKNAAEILELSVAPTTKMLRKKVSTFLRIAQEFSLLQTYWD